MQLSEHKMPGAIGTKGIWYFKYFGKPKFARVGLYSVLSPSYIHTNGVNYRKECVWCFEHIT